MYKGISISVVIPARNEEATVGAVVHKLGELRHDSSPVVDHIIVCDNGSTDDTASIAASAGATVVYEPMPGYGVACLTGISAVPACDVIVFIDADDSVVTVELLALLEKVTLGAEMVIGVRQSKLRQPGAMSWPQLVGNFVAVTLIKIIWWKNVSDLGPFRVIRSRALQQLNMRDRAFGWTVEMQVKAIQQNVRTDYVNVSCKRRVGQSKISGTMAGVIRAAHGIISTILILAFSNTPDTRSSATQLDKPKL